VTGLTLRRPDVADRLFVAACVLAAVVLLALGAGLTFFSDEWAFIESRSLGDPGTWFAPHNEHWSTVPVLVYRALVETIGIGSYLPYLAILIGLHLTVAGLVYVLVRRSSGPWPGLAVGVVVLFLGSGFENLFWAFQIGFVGATAAGLGAVLAFDAHPLTRGRAVAGTVLVLIGLATQGGPGLIWFGAVALELLLDPRRRRFVLFLAIPAAAYAVWYLLAGHVGIDSHQGLFSLGGIGDLAPTIAIGLATVAGALTGVGPTLGAFVLLGVVAFAVALALRGWPPTPALRLVATFAAVIALYGLIALARSFAGTDVASLTRYTYVGVVLCCIGLAAQVGRPVMTTPTSRRAWLAAGATVLTLSLVWNVRLLFAGRALFAERAERTRAFVMVALERPLPASTDPERTLVLIPAPDAVARIVAAYGSPLNDWLVPWAVAPIRPEVLAEAQEILEEGAEIPLPSPTKP
jgi:hypothetical protein